MARYPLVNAHGQVENVIEWDGETAYAPPPGLEIAPPSATANVGDVWDSETKTFVRPVSDDDLKRAAAEELLQGDALAGVTEVLISKGVITKAELPAEARAILDRRAELRVLIANGNATERA